MHNLRNGRKNNNVEIDPPTGYSYEDAVASKVERNVP